MPADESKLSYDVAKKINSFHLLADMHVIYNYNCFG